jgi:hypothetical protein
MSMTLFLQVSFFLSLSNLEIGGKMCPIWLAAVSNLPLHILVAIYCYGTDLIIRHDKIYEL